MFEIKLNGQIQKFDKAINGTQLLDFLDNSVRKNCLALKIDDEICDLSDKISQNCSIEFVMANTAAGLDIIRHDAAHIMAQAVKRLFPHAQVTIGPTIENGFYYDFADIEPLNEANLQEIEKAMQEIIEQDLPISKKTVSKKAAVEFFQKQKEFYKVEIINDLPDTEEISIYTQGDFTDLCRGPHSPSTASVKAFKLMKVSGAYWRGDSNNPMLQRVYGTAWPDRKQLKKYLLFLEEAAKRDHRKIGKQMNLFHFQEQAQGSVFWHPQGWKLFLIMVDYMREQQNLNGYLEINTPEIMAQELWQDSGHWDKFRENMFTAETPEKNKLYAVRPMNCPGGVQIFKQGITSYRDLPLRLAEFGKVHRYEPSGALYGLMRVRAFTQDDAHIYCTPEQITDECIKVCQLVIKIYQDFGFEDVAIKFSDRPEQRIGDDSTWDKSEKALLAALDKQKLEYSINKGEGAFYGPKLEFVLRDAIGRDWQLGTLQVDFNLPERFDLNYVDKHGNKVRPIMLHRALFGSIERFIGILLEHYSGRLPLWIAPTQVVIATISETANKYAQELYKSLQQNGIRCALDVENEQISYKIRTHSLTKTPIIAIIGHDEVTNKTVTLRKINQKNQETLEFDKFVDKLLYEIKTGVQNN
jgi:threonyl-tRNA synthetase